MGRLPRRRTKARLAESTHCHQSFPQAERVLQVMPHDPHHRVSEHVQPVFTLLLEHELITALIDAANTGVSVLHGPVEYSMSLTTRCEAANFTFASMSSRAECL